MRSFLSEKRKFPVTPENKCALIAEFSQVFDFIEVLNPLSELAFDDLISDEPRLAFAKGQMEREVGPSKVALALKTGILCQSKVPSLSYQQRVS